VLVEVCPVREGERERRPWPSDECHQLAKSGQSPMVVRGVPHAEGWSEHGSLRSHVALPGLGGARLSHPVVATGEARFRGYTAISDAPWPLGGSVDPRDLRSVKNLGPALFGSWKQLQGII
jgi:hypothetical protein